MIMDPAWTAQERGHLENASSARARGPLGRAAGLKNSYLYVYVDSGSRAVLDKYTCPHCNWVLRDAVQLPTCGHWLCEECAKEHLSQGQRHPVICPRSDCGVELAAEDGMEYSPNEVVREEIRSLEVGCCNQEKGCSWKGKLDECEAHHEECNYALEVCGLGRPVPAVDSGSHQTECSVAMRSCPFAVHGCPTGLMREAQLKEHCSAQLAEHVEYLAEKLEHFSQAVRQLQSSYSYSPVHSVEEIEMSELTSHQEEARPEITEATILIPPMLSAARVTHLQYLHSDCVSEQSFSELREDMHSMKREVQKNDRDIVTLQRKFDDLSESSSYNGVIVWKIPQFRQCRSDARTGRYTSMHSPPFYTSRYGYKMCLRLYILGHVDGTGAGKTMHMSLFFVIMRNDFDNILQWPFTHRVTFKLINQCGGCDIVNTFQPDPASSSFRKPKSDMNIASGCPKFVSHKELRNGFIVDDTLFIKCIVDCHNPT